MESLRTVRISFAGSLVLLILGLAVAWSAATPRQLTRSDETGGGACPTCIECVLDMCNWDGQDCHTVEMIGCDEDEGPVEKQCLFDDNKEPCWGPDYCGHKECTGCEK